MSNVIKIGRRVGKIRASYRLPELEALPPGGEDSAGGCEPAETQPGEEENSQLNRNARHYEAIGETDQDITCDHTGASGESLDMSSSLLLREYERGFKEGYEAARKELEETYEKELMETRHLMTSFVRNMYDQFDEYRHKTELFVMEFSVAIAEKIIKREVQKHKDVVIAIIKDALHKVIGVEKVKVLVNPEDEKLVRTQRNQLMASADSIRELVIEADDKIERGGCVIESSHGNVDARLSTQLRNIEEALQERVQRTQRSVGRELKRRRKK